jgi:uncharacterized membrane protein YsdA (DUF1294 family)
VPPLASAIVFVFAAFLALATMQGKLSALLLALYLVASIVAFTVYASDKSAAHNGRWRTRESTLHLLALIGGWPGALIAQKVLRHKSKKQPFQVIYWITVTVNCTLLVSLLMI